jgi:hypothetical protein
MTEQPSHVLVSFCNVTGGAPTLALVNVVSGSASVLRVPDDVSRRGGISGTLLTSRYLFAVLPNTMTMSPNRPSSLLVFDRRDLTLLTDHAFSSIVDAHSLLAIDGGLLVVSTGTDEVTRVRLEGAEVVAEEVVWRMDANGPRADVHHLNAICSRGGELLVSGFGKKTGDTWSTAGSGFIVNITSGETIATGIGHPHSIIDVDGTMAYCESSTATLRMMGGARSQQLPGYPRGVCLAGDRLMVGTSQGRRTSKSTGLTNRADPGTTAGRCAVVMLALPNLTIERVVYLDDLAFELYDLQAVETIAGWPVVEETEWRKSRSTGLQAAYEACAATITWLHTEVSARDADITQLHREVALRDRTIAELHREVAVRDQRIREFVRP